jgi:hypothetical protein
MVCPQCKKLAALTLEFSHFARSFSRALLVLPVDEAIGAAPPRLGADELAGGGGGRRAGAGAALVERCRAATQGAGALGRAAAQPASRGQHARAAAHAQRRRSRRRRLPPLGAAAAAAPPSPTTATATSAATTTTTAPHEPAPGGRAQVVATGVAVWRRTPKALGRRRQQDQLAHALNQMRHVPKF